MVALIEALDEKTLKHSTTIVKELGPQVWHGLCEYRYLWRGSVCMCPCVCVCVCMCVCVHVHACVCVCVAYLMTEG